MKKWMWSLVAVLMLVGCQQEPVVDTLDSGKNIPVAVEVEAVNVEGLVSAAAQELAVRVTQGGEAVDDADAVTFEVWESGKRDASVMLDGQLTDDGVYSVNHTFAHDGVYYMYAHTTARGMHVMPKIELIVGNPDYDKVIGDTDTPSMDDERLQEKHTH